MTDLVWMPGDEGCRSRKVPVAGVLWHWTAGSGDAPAVIRTLKERGLSIHYVIDYHGVITQCADPATTVCYHGGSRANERFVGIEISNKALGAPKPGRPQATASGRAHGRTFTVLDFTDAQYASIVALADELSERFDIPRVCATGHTVMKPAALASFRGHLEHVHVSAKKIDCSGLVMAKLRANGYA